MGTFCILSVHRYDTCVYFTQLFIVHSSTGTDRIDFKFYDLLEQILEKQPSTSSTMVTDSIEISEDSNSESVAEGKISSVYEISEQNNKTIVFSLHQIRFMA